MANTRVVNRSSDRQVIKSAIAHTMSQSPEFQASSIGRGNLGEGVDPFLQIDHFRMARPVFPPHPHAGFSALTYMFEDSEGAFINRDSLSPETSILIHPGDLHWTQAGSGIIHEEVPAQNGTICHGLQIFVNLAAKDKFSEPQAFHLSASEIPVWEDDETSVRVVLGEAFGLRSPLETLTPVTMLDVTLSARKEISHTVPAGHNAFVLAVRGSGDFNGYGLSADSAALFDRHGDTLSVKAGRQELQYVLCMGQPLNEPIYAQGPFVMNSAAQIQQVHHRYLSGQMGELS